MSKTTELALDIAAFANILAKTGFEDALSNQKLFVEMCNEAGFRTVKGLEFTQMSYRQMMARLPQNIKHQIRDTCSWGSFASTSNFSDEHTIGE